MVVSDEQHNFPFGKEYLDHYTENGLWGTRMAAERLWLYFKQQEIETWTRVGTEKMKRSDWLETLLWG